MSFSVTKSVRHHSNAQRWFGGAVIDSRGSRFASLVEMAIAMLGLAAAFGGNVVGYEIGRRIGPPLYARDGRIIKRKHFDQTHEFFDRHGSTALVLGRFVAFVRTFITVVAACAVAVVLIMGLWNMMRGGSPNRSQALMRMRVLLQFIAIVIAMTALYFTSG